MAKSENERAGVSNPVLVGLAALIAGGGMLALSARRSGRSLRGELVAGPVLAIRNRAGGSSSPEASARMIALNRKAGPAQPSAAIRRRYTIGQETIDGGQALTISRKGMRSRQRILYIHGGAFVLDLLPEHWPILTALADQVEATIIVPLYPLAPENDWQPAYAMVGNLLGHLIADLGAENVIMVGDSAGGGLILSICQRFRDRVRTLPAGLVLLSPWADLTVSDPAQTEIAKRDKVLSIDRLREAGYAWAGALKSNDPVVSPLFGSLHDLPPMLVMTGTDDILNSDAHRLACSAKASNSSFDLREYRGMFHVWMVAPIPEAKAAMVEVCDFVNLRFAAASY